MFRVPKKDIQNIYGKLEIKFELFTFCDDLSKYYQKVILQLQDVEHLLWLN